MKREQITKEQTKKLLAFYMRKRDVSNKAVRAFLTTRIDKLIAKLMPFNL